MSKGIEKYLDLETKVQQSSQNHKDDIEPSDDLSKDDSRYDQSFINDNSINEENINPNFRYHDIQLETPQPILN